MVLRTPSALHDALRERLLEARSPDSGFGPLPGAAPEPEPTALAAIALDDEAARSWLLAHQAEDGGFGMRIGDDVSDAATSVAALALAPGEAQERSLDHLVRSRAERIPFAANVPHDPETAGWGWTPDTFGWVEPTARAVLALRLLRPTAGVAIADGVALLRDRECVRGGWNYGNPVVFGETLPPFAQTTGIALVGLHGLGLDVVERGLGVLRELWRRERGGLSLATALTAFRLAGDEEAQAVVQVLEGRLRAVRSFGDVVALAWATLATGDGVERLRVEAG